MENSDIETPSSKRIRLSIDINSTKGTENISSSHHESRVGENFQASFNPINFCETSTFETENTFYEFKQHKINLQEGTIIKFYFDENDKANFILACIVKSNDIIQENEFKSIHPLRVFNGIEEFDVTIEVNLSSNHHDETLKDLIVPPELLSGLFDSFQRLHTLKFYYI